MHFFTRILVLLLASLVSVAYGQSIPRAGTRFTFAVPEGADRIWVITTPSTLTLNVLSPHDGNGVVWSPSGVMIPFTFTANQATVVNLPYSLMTLHDLGKSQKGIIVRTTQPVNLAFHNALDYAGEATQIWPDEALDTNYLVPGWGLWNDVQENNRSQITVVATENNTTVTVTPSVNCIGGELKGVPSTMTLQRGECYIIKADTSGLPVVTSLFGSRISSDKPVSVLTSTTCAYVPLENQACNEIIDHLLPLKNVGTEFYVSTPVEVGHKCRVLFISETPDFFVFTPGSTALSKNGRAELSINQPSRFQTSAPVQCYLLTEGSWSYSFSDPSIVTVLPVDKYHDSLLWYSPRILTETIPLYHFASVIYPTANKDEIFVDNNAIGLYPNTVEIAGTPMSAAMISVREGVHRINSPVPVYGTAYGFFTADAYSFVITGKGPRIVIDSPAVNLRTSFPDGKTCEVFTGTVFLEEGFQIPDDAHQFRLTVTYDPAAVRLVQAIPTGLLAAQTVTLDTSVPGVITAYAHSYPTAIVGTGELLSISFYGIRPGPTSVMSRISISQLEFTHLEVAAHARIDTFNIAQTRYNAQAAMTVLIPDVILGDETIAHVIIDDPLNGLFNEVRIRISYDHDLLTLVENGVLLPSTKLVDWTPVINKIDHRTDEIVFTPTTSSFIEGNGTLVRLRFQSYVSRYDTTTVAASASFTSTDLCPLDVEGVYTGNLFEGIDSCSIPSIRNAFRSLPMEFLDATPNPTTGTIDAFIRHSLAQGDAVNIHLADMAGKRVWTSPTTIPSAPEAHLLITFPSWVASGTYMLSLEAAGYTVSRQIALKR